MQDEVKIVIDLQEKGSATRQQPGQEAKEELSASHRPSTPSSSQPQPHSIPAGVGPSPSSSTSIPPPEPFEPRHSSSPPSPPGKPYPSKEALEWFRTGKASPEIKQLVQEWFSYKSEMESYLQYLTRQGKPAPPIHTVVPMPGLSWKAGESTSPYHIDRRAIEYWESSLKKLQQLSQQHPQKTHAQGTAVPSYPYRYTVATASQPQHPYHQRTQSSSQPATPQSPQLPQWLRGHPDFSKHQEAAVAQYHAQQHTGHSAPSPSLPPSPSQPVPPSSPQHQQPQSQQLNVNQLSHAAKQPSQLPPWIPSFISPPQASTPAAPSHPPRPEASLPEAGRLPAQTQPSVLSASSSHASLDDDDKAGSKLGRILDVIESLKPIISLAETMGADVSPAYRAIDILGQISTIGSSLFSQSKPSSKPVQQEPLQQAEPEKPSSRHTKYYGPKDEDIIYSRPKRSAAGGEREHKQPYDRQAQQPGLQHQAFQSSSSIESKQPDTASSGYADKIISLLEDVVSKLDTMASGMQGMSDGSSPGMSGILNILTMILPFVRELRGLAAIAQVAQSIYTASNSVLNSGK